MSRVILAMSGGVDSSVAAWLLREQGHEVIGLFMRHGQDHASPAIAPSCESNGCKQGCCTAADAADARRVADMLGIPFYAVNFQDEFTRIVDYFVAQYTAGRTPNPCIFCNTWLKFGKLFEYADRLGAEYVATGHYARLVSPSGGSIGLYRGCDASKDQSYVLFGIPRPLLSRILLPVGEFHKEEIRRVAERLGLRVATKRDSQEICFVPDQDHARFIRQRCGDLDTAGEIVTVEGEVVGQHDGFERFTVGQRKGLRLAFGTPRYVVRIERDTHRVVIGTYEQLARTQFTASEANWLVETRQEAKERQNEELTNREPDVRDPSCLASLTSPVFHAQVKIRYRSRPAAAVVQLMPDNRFRVELEEPCYGVAPGQAAVCYWQDRVLGGGWIERHPL